MLDNQTLNMKKTILLIAVSLMSVAAFSQKDSVKSAPKSDTVWVDISKAKVIVLIDGEKSKQPVKMLSAEALGKGDIVIGMPQYWYSLLLFMKGSKNGNFSQQETEQLQQPFYQYAAEWERIVQSMQQPKK